MNVEKLTRLARNDNPTLVYLCKQWMTTQKCGNPVNDAMKLEGFWRACVTQGYIIVGLSMVAAFFKPAAFGYVAVLVLGCVAPLCVFKRNQVQFRNARRFCEAITILEKAIGSLNSDVGGTKWDIGYRPGAGVTVVSGKLKQEAELLLQAEAKKVKELQSIPWKEESAKRSRVKFVHKSFALHFLLGISYEQGQYFNAN